MKFFSVFLTAAFFLLASADSDFNEIKPECAQYQACTFIWDPVCSNTGTTFASECVFKATNCNLSEDEKMEIAYPGECIEDFIRESKDD